MSVTGARGGMASGESPQVTVVIPTKDRWDMFARSLGSVLAQEDVAFEVIVVDDGSSDGAPHHLDALRDPRVHVLRNEISEGVARARNRGMSHARGAWIAFLDDDDLWAPRKLRTELDRAAAGDAEFVYTGMLVTGDAIGPIEVQPMDPQDLPRRLLEDNFVGGPSTVMVRTDLVLGAGGFDEDLSVLADWDLWIRLITNERAVAAACPEPLVAYVLHARNMHRTERDSTLREFRRLAAKHRREGQKVGGSSFFRWVAASHRRSGRRFSAALVYLEAAIRYRQVGDLARAVGMLLGERVIALGRRSAPPITAAEPPWLRSHVD